MDLKDQRRMAASLRKNTEMGWLNLIAVWKGEPHGPTGLPETIDSAFSLLGIWLGNANGAAQEVPIEDPSSIGVLGAMFNRLVKSPRACALTLQLIGLATTEANLRQLEHAITTRELAEAFLSGDGDE